MFVEVEPGGTVSRANVAFARRADTSLDQLIDAPVARYLAGREQGVLGGWLNDEPLPVDAVDVTSVDSVDHGGVPFTLLCLLERSDGGLRLLGEPDVEENDSFTSELMSLNNELATLARERARRERDSVMAVRGPVGSVKGTPRSRARGLAWAVDSSPFFLASAGRGFSSSDSGRNLETPRSLDGAVHLSISGAR